MNEELEKQFEEASKQCPFCKILKGEIKGELVYDDLYFKGVMDINPVSKGHTLLVPKKHYPILPFMSNEEFVHLFGLMPRFAKAVMDGILASGLDIMIANGAAAGQQSPHFLLHLIPREKGDWLTKFSFESTQVVDDQSYGLYHHNLPLMMKNEQPSGEQPEYLKSAKQDRKVVYEDSMCVGVIPNNPLCEGHIMFLGPSNSLTELSQEESIHLFRLASHCATAAYEGYKAAGSNIIVKTGICDDCEDLEVHIVPRHENDGIDFQHPPKKMDKSSPDKIRDEMFYIEHGLKESRKEKLVINLDEKPPEIGETCPLDQIKNAIDKLKN